MLLVTGDQVHDFFRDPLIVTLERVCCATRSDNVTTRDLNKAQIYAWRKGIKTLYYIRLRQLALAGTEVDGCVSCML